MNSLEEVMLEVYRLDYAEFDVLPEHRFSHAHSKAMKKILYPNYSLMMDYRIEQSRVPLKKRILIAALVIILAMIGAAVGAGALKGLRRKTGSDIKAADCIIVWGTTWFEDGIFYETQNMDGESVLCYYSKEKDRSAVMCGMPECTHSSKLSPDCGALAGSNTHSRYGYNRIGDKLYYISIMMPTDDTIGSLDFIESDIDGKNRRIVASIEDTYIPFINDVKYLDGHVLLTYYQNFDLVKNENTGEFEFVYLDKYRFYMQWIDILTGEIETLIYREEYDGIGRGTVYENVVYYSYKYHDVPPTGEMLTPETAPPRCGGFYIRDLSTGEEKFYEDIWPFPDSYIHFSLDKIMADDGKSDKICLYDPETDTFKAIADHYNGGYTSDGKDALFAENTDSKFWTRYNFETGELTQIPGYTGYPRIFPQSARTIGNTTWVNPDSLPGDRNLRHGYVDRDDFYAGKFENIMMIKEVELQ
ncbi:MAG: hypothetical protein K2N38_00020 [Oscillospiraceae bacterium]|nr:hypothetical protein [Oscillospiraceae bacterium]